MTTTARIITLEAGDYVRAPNFTRAFVVGTVRAYAAVRGGDADADMARALANGHDTAYTINPGTVMTGDRAENARRNEIDRKHFNAACLIEDGQIVEIEGDWFTVKVMGERFADPIHFKRVRP